jgi:hypothetical protein
MTEQLIPATEDPQAYVDRVMAEIEEEVRVRRATGDLPPKLERELDELFLAHSPVAGRGGDLADALRMVDATTFIDPVVPVASQKAVGTAVKGGMRKLLLWYVGWVTHQISQFASAVSRTLHIIEGRLNEIERKVEVQRVPNAGVIEFPALHRSDAWWVEPVIGAATKANGRVLHSACGDGWLVQRLNEAKVNAYGVDPRTHLVDQGTLGVVDLRDETLAEHLRSVAASGLGGLVLSGVFDGMGSGERDQLLGLIATTVAPGGLLAVHSVSPTAWASDDAPYEADLAPGRPLRAETWRHLLERAGYRVDIQLGPDAADYLVLATRDGASPATPTQGR